MSIVSHTDKLLSPVVNIAVLGQLFPIFMIQAARSGGKYCASHHTSFLQTNIRSGEKYAANVTGKSHLSLYRSRSLTASYKVSRYFFLSIPRRNRDKSGVRDEVFFVKAPLMSRVFQENFQADSGLLYITFWHGCDRRE